MVWSGLQRRGGSKKDCDFLGINIGLLGLTNQMENVINEVVLIFNIREYNTTRRNSDGDHEFRMAWQTAALDAHAEG